MMKQRNDTLLLTIHGCMEFTWRYAWAGFVMFAMAGRPVPLLEALAVFTLAAVATLFSRGRGWRILYVLLLQAMSLVLAAGVMVHAFYYRSFPFWGRVWIGEFFTSSRTTLEWIVLLFFAFWILVLWAGGVIVTRKPLRYDMICARFDVGLVAFLVLYLLEWLFLERGGIQTQDPIARFLIFPYFLFSIFAIGLARNRDNEQSEILADYRGARTISTIVVTLVLVGTAFFLLLQPFFACVAETGYAFMKEAAGPLGPVAVEILRFLIIGRRTSGYDGASSGAAGDSQPPPVFPDETAWWEEILEALVRWGYLGLIGSALLVLAVAGVWVLVRWLLSRTPSGETGQGKGGFRFIRIEKIWALLTGLRRRILARVWGPRRASRLFARLLAWGRRSGVFRLPGETPGEYGTRLKGRFPDLAEQIELMIDLYHGEVYGRRRMTEGQWTAAGSAWRQLRNPVYWPSRLRSWISRPGITAEPKHQAKTGNSRRITPQTHPSCGRSMHEDSRVKDPFRILDRRT